MVRGLGTHELLPAQNVLAGEGASKAYTDSLNGPPGAVVVSSRAREEEPIKGIIQSLETTGWWIVEPPPAEPSVMEVPEVLAHRTDVEGLSRILAIGGGGIVDFAKALGCLLRAPDRYWQLVDKRHVRLMADYGFPHLIAIPTTIGSGSEVSSSAVLRRPDWIKGYLSGPPLLPQTAILDPLLVMNSPVWVRAWSSLDLIGHALEASMSKLHNPGATLFAESSLRVALSQVQEFLQTDSVEKVLEMQWAGHLAGVAQDRMLVGPAHVLAHHFSSIPHGLGVGWFLRGLVSVYAAEGGELTWRFEQLLTRIGFSQSELVATLDRLLETALVEPHRNLRELTFPTQLEDLESDTAGSASPIPMSEDLLSRIWKEATR